MSRPVLIKLGGSVITDKSKPESFRRAVARRLITEIAKAEVPVVLFHGAGSYGHPQAEQWGLAEPPITGKKLDGVAETLGSVTRLHGEMLGIAATAGLRPVSVPMHALAEADGGLLSDVPMDLIDDLLANGCMPVLHGTMVRDASDGWALVSADRLMAAVAGELEPRLAVFVTDVDGVLDDAGALVPEVTIDHDVAVAAENGADVTGSMRGKVAAALEVAGACPTVILNGNERGRLLDALKGKPVPGTRPLP